MNNQQEKTFNIDLEAPAAPSLTLEPFTEEPTATSTAIAPVEEKAQPAVFDESSLTSEEKKIVEDFAQKIQINNANVILQYGAGAQRKMADFSEGALANVKTKDLGEIGNMLSSVVRELRNFEDEEDEKGGIFGWFKKQSNKLEDMRSRYSRAEVNVNKICTALENHQVQLMKDVAMLDKMYELNKVYFKELSMYILAGRRKLQSTRDNELKNAMEQAKRTGLPEDAQQANDMANLCDRFEKKLHDLELTRMISIQMAPQIRLVQNNDTLMTEKIQSTLVNTIPLWKSQMVLALGVQHSQQAAAAQRAVTDMTNELLRKNAETLKMATIETAKESERGIVDVETLKATNESLIATLDEVARIQEEGRQKRRAAEQELNRIEGELKQKLLQIRN